MIDFCCHPGFILILAGLLACKAPAILRKALLILGPAMALGAAFMLPEAAVLDITFLGHKLNVVQADKLSWIFTFAFSVLALVSSLYGLNCKSGLEAMSALGYAGSAICLVLCRDWMSFIFFWEALAVTSVFLVWCNNTPESRRAGFRYILVHMLGGNLLLFGIFLLVGQTGNYTVQSLTNAPHNLAYWAILAGVCVNVAMPPVNGWLVDAYSNSTLSGGVYMSCLTTKVAVYALLRLFSGTELIMWGGVLMALYGALYAIMENDMRKLLAHHIISQTGFMVAGCGIGTGLAMNGATAHAFCDIIFKSLLFMCAGAVIYATGLKKINQVGNMARRLPIVALCFFSAAFSIAGIPGFNGFISKAITVNASAAAGQDLVYLLLEVASIGTFLSIPLKMGWFIFLRKEDKGSQIVNPLPWHMTLAMCISGTLCFLYGVVPDLLYRHLPFASEVYVPFTAPHVLQYVQMLGMAMIPFMMYLHKMEPHTAISLDTDWFYRKPFAAVVSGVSGAMCAVMSGLSNAWGSAYMKFNELSENPMIWLDARPFHEGMRYRPRDYRTSIADPIMIILTVLLFTFAYTLAKMMVK